MIVGSAGATVSMNTDPVALYGNEIAFDVFRENKRVGSHTVRFDRLDRELRVNSRFELSIDVLFFTVYQFQYQSDATWRAGAIERISVDVDDNGEAFQLKAKRRGEITEIQSDAGLVNFTGGLFPTNHWNADVLRASQVLNTLTGKVNTVSIEARGRENIVTKRGVIEATRYAYTGELETEVWCDASGRWVKMRFAGKDGVPIDYVCRRCQGPVSAPEKE